MVGAALAASHQILYRSASVLRLRALTERAPALRKSMLRTAPESLQALWASLARQRPNQNLLQFLEHQVRRLRAIRPL